jgi:hypothetical protein
MRILFHLPTRSRPEKAKACIENIHASCVSDDYIILVTADRDDVSMNGFASIFLHDKKVVVAYGDSKSKIEACNRDIELVKDWDILVNTSDDMWFESLADDQIRRAFKEMRTVNGYPYSFVDNLDQLIHFNDGNQKGNVCTLSIMGRPYYDAQGYVYHPDYKSLWCDAEETEKAYMLGKYRYMGDSLVIFHHLHPAWGKAQYDDQYRKTEDRSMWDHDKAIIEKRRAMNYYLPLNQIKNGFKYGQQL